MSSFYSDASLVMIPSGYKTSKVYCAKPTDGGADLSFTRSNDTATRVGPDGLIEKVRTNLILQSETFDNAAWGKSAVGINTAIGTSGIEANVALAPNGTTTADRVNFLNQADNDLGLNQTINISASTTYASSFYIKGEGTDVGKQVRIKMKRASSGTAVTVVNTVTLTSDWVRVPTTLTMAADNVDLQLIISSNVGGAVTCLLWGGQLETGDIATDYIATTTAAVSVGPVANVPRLDYLGSTCPRLLLEPQRQNVCLWSEQINNAGWTKNNGPTITTNIATAPDGYGGADGIQSITGGAFRTISQTFSVSANSTITASVFVKKETSETAFGGLGILFQGTSTKTCYTIFNAVTGTGLISGSSLTGTIKVDDYGNYWRLQVTTTDNGSNTTLSFSYYGTLSANGTTIGADAGSVRTVWGFQLEIGASYASSYVNTLGAAVTRGADAANNLAASSLIGTTEGVIFIDIQTPSTIGANSTFSIGAGTSAEYAQIEIRTDLSINWRYRVGGTDYINANVGSFTAGSRLKIAFAYKNLDSILYLNGSSIATDTGTIATNAWDEVRFTNFAGTGNLEARVNQTLLFPTRLTNAQLAELTTL